MELKSANIRVLHFTESGEDEERTEEAILFVPFSSVQRFLTRLEDYRRDVEQGKVDNTSQKDLVEYTSSIEYALYLIRQSFEKHLEYHNGS